MTTSGAVWFLLIAPLSALTPTERWSAARRMNSEFASEYRFVLAGGLVLLVLFGLLWWVSIRRKEKGVGTREPFGEGAARRRLTPRERQVLLAIAARSGLRRNEKIFRAVKAFERGAEQLLQDCVGTRTAEESARLRVEVMGLRRKLGFAQKNDETETEAASVGPSSREIPAGRLVQLTRLSTRESIPVEAKVVRNDDVEFVVELATVVTEGAGTYWRVRYCEGTSVWEFDTSAVGADGPRLILNHQDEVSLVDRRRFTRVAVHVHARIALFPFVRRVQGSGAVSEAAQGVPAGDGDWGLCDGPEFVEGSVTEWAGPGLRVKAPLRARVGDRLLIAFEVSCVALAGPEQTGMEPGCGIVEHIGIVRQVRDTGDGASMSVEMTGLSETEVAELVRIMGTYVPMNDAGDRSFRRAAMAGSAPRQGV